jgi:hypothetical protein
LVDALTFAFDVVTDPRVGLPILLFASAILLWVATRPASDPRWERGEPAPPEPNRDAVSRTYLAVRKEAYSSVLVETHHRLDRAMFARSGHRLGEIPWFASAARRLGVPDPKGLRGSRISLDSLYLWAVRLETSSWRRWDFWRSDAASRAKFRERLSERLTVVDCQLHSLGYAP